MTLIWVWALITIVFLGLELVGEVRDDHRLVWVAKPVASTGFIGVALTAGALSNTYGQIVLLACAFCWLGDVLLIPKDSRKAFLGGLVSFLLGHVAYAVAFVVVGVDLEAVMMSAAGLLLPLALIARWLMPNVEGRMKGPVIAYMIVISVMVALAVGTGRSVLVVAAVLFYVSDLAVARQRFIRPAHANRLVGLPLYFAAQLVFATTAGGF